MHLTTYSINSCTISFEEMKRIVLSVKWHNGRNSDSKAAQQRHYTEL